jgi:diguanylate cyclase (GGDEF)-like protein
MKKVLVIDDDLELQELLKFSFQHFGYDVYQAYDGKEGLKKIKEVLPDIIVLDIIMPEMNGFEVIEEIKQDPELCLIPVIMMTSLGHTRDKITGVKLGADEYIVKPVEPYELIARVEGLIKRYYENVDELTRLPGLVLLENQVKELISANKKFSVIYIDICNFKAYNLKYGFEQGDRIIKLFSGMLRSVVKSCGTDKDIICHLEADDFSILSFTAKIQSIVENIISLFDNLSTQVYDEETLKNGYFVYKLNDIELKSPLLKLAIAVVSVQEGKYTHYAEILTFSKELLSFVKQQVKQTNQNMFVFK